MRLGLAVGASLLLCWMPINDLSAQQVAPAAVAVGDRVRFQIQGETKAKTARVLDATDDRLRVEFLDEQGVGDLRLRDLRSLDRSTGRKSTLSSATRGTLWGAVAGGVVTALYVAAGSASCRGDCEGQALGAALAGTIFTTSGAIIGGLAGAASPGERWQPVSVR